MRKANGVKLGRKSGSRNTRLNHICTKNHDFIVSQLQNKMSIPKIAKILGVSKGTLYRYLAYTKARYQGYGFFFKEGFCWNNVLNPNARLLKAKMKSASVNDVGSMSLKTLLNNIPNYYFVSILNSDFIFDYYREFINCTVNIQINDIRQVPVVIPARQELEKLEPLFKKAFSCSSYGGSFSVVNPSRVAVHPVHRFCNFILPGVNKFAFPHTLCYIVFI